MRYTKPITIHVYLLTENHLALTELTGPTLDAVSLQLPEGVYTTLRTYDRMRILGLSAHLQRLADSLARLNKARSLDLTALRAALRTVLEQEGLPAARLRIIAPFESDQVFISIEPFEGYPAEYYAHGVRCHTTRLTRDRPDAKQTAFIAPSRHAKVEHGPAIHELLIVDEAGRILEGISSNFFAVLDGTLRTAGEEVLAGVTRAAVLAEAAKLLPVVFEPIGLADLLRLTEAFITSSSREVMPVIEIDRRVIGAGQPGPITRTLIARYRDYWLQAAELP
ncbi:MAG TPA: aminotransferase class IV [Anaerolineae bacterium]|nr:aminotransferase class IV [Anaerolineae bacterium]